MSVNVLYVAAVDQTVYISRPYHITVFLNGLQANGDKP